MSKEKSKPLFTHEFIEVIRRARELNEQESKGKDVYHHPTEAGIVPKSIALTSQKPLGRFGGKQPKSCSKERWVEAYLIRKAKRNNWVLKLADKQYRLLYSQLQFRREGKTQGEKHRLLDLLLYDIHDKNLVILELKSRRALKEAKGELDYYGRKISECMDGLKEAFDLDQIKGVVSYIVWPKSSRGGEWSRDLNKCLGNYGLIEYNKIPKPWEAFREAMKQGKDLEVEFICRKRAE